MDSDFEELLVGMKGQRLVTILLDFIETLNDVLSNGFERDRTWNQRLITQIGGTGTLFNLWDCLKRTQKVTQKTQKGRFRIT